jgi:hypothetical protein
MTRTGMLAELINLIFLQVPCSPTARRHEYQRKGRCATGPQYHLECVYPPCRENR